MVGEEEGRCLDAFEAVEAVQVEWVMKGQVGIDAIRMYSVGGTVGEGGRC